MGETAGAFFQFAIEGLLGGSGTFMLALGLPTAYYLVVGYHWCGLLVDRSRFEHARLVLIMILTPLAIVLGTLTVFIVDAVKYPADYTAFLGAAYGCVGSLVAGVLVAVALVVTHYARRNVTGERKVRSSPWIELIWVLVTLLGFGLVVALLFNLPG
jgi:hypothetical protein